MRLLSDSIKSWTLSLRFPSGSPIFENVPPVAAYYYTPRARAVIRATVKKTDAITNRQYQELNLTFQTSHILKMHHLLRDFATSFAAKAYLGCSLQSKWPASEPCCCLVTRVRPVLPVSLRECTNTIAWCPFLRLSQDLQSPHFTKF